jgi:SPOR domain
MRWMLIALLFAALPARADGPALKPGVGEGYLFQLGAEHSEAEAAHSWIVIAARAGGALDGLKPEITPVRLPRKGRLWRLRGGPVDAAGAAAVCVALKAKGIDCIVVH